MSTMALPWQDSGNTMGILWECSGIAMGMLWEEYGGKRGSALGNAMGCENSMWE